MEFSQTLQFVFYGVRDWFCPLCGALWVVRFARKFLCHDQVDHLFHHHRTEPEAEQRSCRQKHYVTLSLRTIMLCIDVTVPELFIAELDTQQRACRQKHSITLSLYTIMLCTDVTVPELFIMELETHQRSYRQKDYISLSLCIVSLYILL